MMTVIVSWILYCRIPWEAMLIQWWYAVPTRVHPVLMRLSMLSSLPTGWAKKRVASETTAYRIVLNAVFLQARNIKNKPVVNRDPQSVRFEEMQCEIKVRKFICASCNLEDSNRIWLVVWVFLFFFSLQALREELNRQRTSMIPGTFDPEVSRAIGEVSQMKEMEDKMSR